MASTPDPRSLDPTNVIRPLLLIVRPEADGTLTLLLDVPQSDALPLELGGGFRSFDQVLQVVMQALTAPAVAEDRVTGIEEALPTVNQLVDSVNDLTDQVGNLKTKIGWLEDEVADLRASRARPREEWGRSAPGGRIPRLGERRPGVSGAGDPRIHPRGQYYDQRAAWDEQARQRLPEEGFTGDAHRPDWTGTIHRDPAPRMPQRPAQPPQPPQEPRPVVHEGPRPTFDRGSFEPHQPIGRVARGPGTPD